VAAPIVVPTVAPNWASDAAIAELEAKVARVGPPPHPATPAVPGAAVTRRVLQPPALLPLSRRSWQLPSLMAPSCCYWVFLR